MHSHNFLNMLNKRGKVALFVGAGVSVGCGLPNWDELVDRLISRAFPDHIGETKQALANFSSAAKARILRSKLDVKFNSTVADVLYEAPYGPSQTVKEIARSGIRRICTYNYDDILEETYSSDGRQFQSVLPRDRFSNNFRGTAIFHPHGFLPNGLSKEDEQNVEIVLCEEEYNRLYSDPYAWPNIIQLSLLVNYTCLFVGVSLQDPNLRRLLDAFNKMNLTHQHHAIFASPMYASAEWDKSLNRQIKATIERDLSSLRIKPVWLRTYEEIPSFIKSIRNAKESNSR